MAAGSFLAKLRYAGLIEGPRYGAHLCQADIAASLTPKGASLLKEMEAEEIWCPNGEEAP